MNKGFLSHWRRAAGTKRIVYPMITFFLLTPFLLSCGGSSSTPGAETDPPPSSETKPQSVSNILIEPDPMEKMISRIDFTTTGPNQIESVEFYGTKENLSAIAESALIYVTGVDGSTIIQFDDFGRPNQIYMPDGTQFFIEYNSESGIICECNVGFAISVAMVASRYCA